MSSDPAAYVSAVQVNLFCEDVEAVTRFYDALGFPRVFAVPAEGPPEHVELDVAGTRIGLTSVEAANRIADLGVVAPVAAGSEVVLWCRDADELFRAALGAGATALVPPRDSPDGRIRYGWVRDPEGHQLKFVTPL